MAYTIKGLAKANECESLDCYGLAILWQYWIDCNTHTPQVINDFLRLNRKDRNTMMDFLIGDYPDIANHIIRRYWF